MRYVFDPAPVPTLSVEGRSDRFPVHRVFCVGRNFSEHALEMGNTVDRTTPFYFTKSSHHVREAKGQIAIASQTQDYHHEVELVVALKGGGTNISKNLSLSHVFGYAVGLDMTRRDLQKTAKDKRRPWATAKDVQEFALVGPLLETSIPNGPICLAVNEDIRQLGHLSEMIWSVEEIISDLSKLYTLHAGDLIFMGTPSGVGPVHIGDTLKGSIEGLPKLELTLVGSD